MEKQNTYLKPFIENYKEYRDQNLSGRLITHGQILSSLEKISAGYRVSEIGKSTRGKTIHSITLGSGKIKVLAWSQMHGNESTTTKSVFDLLNAFLLLKDESAVKNILSHINFKVLPYLNPDGAEAYTRENANMVDLNRDAYNLKEIESRILRQEFDSFQPHFCLNLHDQRTIFSAGNYPEPAVLSFLTPAMNEEREVTESRKQSMKVIAAINQDLQSLLPQRIGRYDDAYNRNCTGDTFQSLEVPTILFEAGHFPGDYPREKTREYVSYALISALHHITTQDYKKFSYSTYFDIPENQKLFYDVILRHARVNEEIVDVAIQFKETPNEGKIFFIPFLEKVEPSLPFYGHREIDCKKKEVKWEGSTKPSENVIVNKIFMNNEILIIN